MNNNKLIIINIENLKMSLQMMKSGSTGGGGHSQIT